MKRQNLPLIVLGACWLAGACGYAYGDEEPGASRRRAGHILHAWDGCPMWLTILDQRDGTVNRDIPERAARYSKRMLEEMIDEEAAAHVDAISYCLFTAFWSDLPTSQVTDLFPWRPAGMDEVGMDPLKVLIDRCHQHDMQFIADIRMNDRHGVPPNGTVLGGCLGPFLVCIG